MFVRVYLDLDGSGSAETVGINAFVSINLSGPSKTKASKINKFYTNYAVGKPSGTWLDSLAW